MSLSNINILILGALICIFSLCSIVSADPVAPYGGVATNYTAQVGNDQMNIYTSLPITMEDVAYPSDLFYFIISVGSIFLVLGIICTSFRDRVPSMAILGCGVFAFGTFLIAAIMAPYVVDHNIMHQVVPTVGANGSTPANASNTIYVTEVNTYLFSAWVGYAMWGGAVAGFVMMILGTLSYIGWFESRGMDKAFVGEYLETDEE